MQVHFNSRSGVITPEKDRIGNEGLMTLRQALEGLADVQLLARRLYGEAMVISIEISDRYDLSKGVPKRDSLAFVYRKEMTA